ncbi:MAG: sugar ABC transporter permease [Syntrophaceae bacterium]|nr:sugar ABC transporter permease [Syntrophaceae bacterium]
MAEILPVAMPSPTVVRREHWSRKTSLGLLFCSPLILIFLVLVITPMLYEVYLGLDRTIYPAIFSDPIFIQTIFNTIIFVGVAVNVKMFLALVLSALFCVEHWAIRVLGGLFLLPWAIPSLPGIFSFRWMLNGQWGIINKILIDFGLEGYPWLVRRPTALAAAIIYHIWKYLPFWTLIFVAGRRSIPRELYEASDIDGARPLQKFRYVTFPMLQNLYLICSLLSMVFTLGDFVIIKLMTGGAPGDSTHVLATLAYRYTFQMGKIDWGVGVFTTALPVTLLFIFILIRKVK